MLSNTSFSRTEAMEAKLHLILTLIHNEVTFIVSLLYIEGTHGHDGKEETPITT
jgi:hypothetical protein